MTTEPSAKTEPDSACPLPPAAPEWSPLSSWRVVVPAPPSSEKALRSPPPRKKLPVVPTAANITASRKHANEASGKRELETKATPRISARCSPESQLEQLVTQNTQLRHELQSLRDMYAKHTAHVELKCDRMLRDKDAECAEWYKDKRQFLDQMKAGVVIMKRLWDSKQRRLMKELDVEHIEHVTCEKDFTCQVQILAEERAMEKKRFKELLEENTSKHEVALADVQRQKSEAEREAARIAEQLEEARKEIDHWKETHRQKEHELEQCKKQLAEVNKNNDIEGRDEQIQHLEAELQLTKKTLKERWKKEVEGLRQELMDYVQFIVHILPDNWLQTEASKNVPPELRDQLSWMDLSQSGTPKRANRSPHAKSLSSPKGIQSCPKGKGIFLPPADILAKGAALGMQHASAGVDTLTSPRARAADRVDVSF